MHYKSTTEPHTFVTILTLLMLLFSPSLCHSQEKYHHILYINSYDPSLPHFNEQYSGIMSVFNNSNVIVNVEFMDCKRFDDDDNINSFKNRIVYKLKKFSQYEAIIVSDDNAFDFVLENQKTLFKNIPIVFFGVNNIPKAFLQNQNPWVTGIVEDISIKETIDLMIKLFPKHNYIYILHDNSLTGRAEMDSFNSFAPLYKREHFKIISLSKYTFNDFYGLLSKIAPNNPVLYLNSFIDKDGNATSFKEAFSEVNAHLHAPLFYILNIGVGKGALGGKVISFYKQGRMTAQIVDRILKGAPISKMKVINSFPNDYTFDYNKLKEYNIDTSLLPKGSIIINKPVSIFNLYKKTAFFVIFSIIILICLIVVLILNARKRKKTVQELYLQNKRLETSMNRIKEADRTFRVVSRQSISGIVIVDFAGYITYTNSTFCTTLGYKNEELLGKSIYQYIKISDRGKLVLTVEASMEEPIPIIFIHKDGTEIITDFIFKAVIIDDKEQLLCTIHDITQMVQTKQELILAKEKAEESDRLKSEFIHNLSHEIKTPMTGIIGFTDLLTADPDAREANEGYIEIIRNCVKQLTRIIRDILEISRLETKQVKVIEEQTNLNDLLSDQYYIFQDTAKKKGISIILDKELKDDDCTIMIDASKLIKIISNLIENAFKFTTEGHIKIGYHIEGESISLYVEDTGIGIPIEQQQCIFDRFAQLDKELSRKYEGLGLGLAIAKENAMLLNGNITLTSEPGKGSTFFVHIPFKKVNR